MAAYAAVSLLTQLNPRLRLNAIREAITIYSARKLGLAAYAAYFAANAAKSSLMAKRHMSDYIRCPSQVNLRGHLICRTHG